MTTFNFDLFAADYCKLTSYEEQQSFIKANATEEHSVKSLVGKLSKRGLYHSKPKPKKPSTKILNLETRDGHILTLSISKDRILQELEDRLKLDPGCLFSMRTATKEAIASLILGIKAIEDGLIEPEMETFFDELI